MSGRWSQRLWARGETIYDAILQHPFLTGLASGDLDPACFAHYLAQDAHYLRDYARALALVAAKATTHTDGGLFAAHAAQTVTVELALHEQLLPQLGLDPAALEAVEPSPTTTAYTSYLLATTHGGAFAEGLAAVLPCYWIYQRVGEALVARGSPDPRYQRWIDTYSGDEFTQTVAAVLEVVDRIGAGLGEGERERAERHFVMTARYEWMFWDAAWRQEAWPVFGGAAHVAVGAGR